MSQHDLVIDNASGATVRSDLNSALQALGSLNAGATEPSTTYAYMPWADTTNNVLKIRNAADSAWIDTGISLTADRTLTGDSAVTGKLNVGNALRVNYGASGWFVGPGGVGNPLRFSPDASGTTDTSKGATVNRTTGIWSFLNGIAIAAGSLAFPDASTQVRAANKVLFHQVEKTDTFSMASVDWTDVTGLSVTFTPVSASSVMLILLSMQAVATGSTGGIAQLLRGASPIHVGATAGDRRVASCNIPFDALSGANACHHVGSIYYDEPATASSVTYKVQVARPYGSGSIYVNRSAEDTDDSYRSRLASSLVVVEIA